MVAVMRVLGIDPGLTRCGIGIVEGSPGLALKMVGVVGRVVECVIKRVNSLRRDVNPLRAVHANGCKKNTCVRMEFHL